MFNSVLLLLLLGFTMRAAAGELAVSADFPGGSASVEKIDQDSRTVQFGPGGPMERGWVCWWYFRLSGITPGETITLDAGNGAMATPDQAFYSVDGREWRQMEPGKRNRGRIVYRQRVDSHAAYFAWGPPFVLSDAEALVGNAEKRSPHVARFELCKSRDNRTVPGMRVSFPSEMENRRGIWIQARQHAWETGSSWVCQGFVDWLLSEDPRAERLRTAAEFTIIPIMDVDNVEKGYGGKRQQPHDHNRDWSDAPHWPEVTAAIREIRALHAAGRFDAFIDLHNPASGDRQPFFFVAPDSIHSPSGRDGLARFLASARLEIASPLKLAGEPRESGLDYDPMWRQIAKNWVMQHTHGNALAVTLETAWNTPHSTTDGYRTVGRQLGLALERWLRSSTREGQTVE